MWAIFLFADFLEGNKMGHPQINPTREVNEK
jgi:hypothetical protein